MSSRFNDKNALSKLTKKFPDFSCTHGRMCVYGRYAFGEAGSLRGREEGEKFKKASFCYLLLLTSRQRNEPKNVS